MLAKRNATAAFLFFSKNELSNTLHKSTGTFDQYNTRGRYVSTGFRIDIGSRINRVDWLRTITVCDQCKPVVRCRLTLLGLIFVCGKNWKTGFRGVSLTVWVKQQWDWDVRMESGRQRKTEFISFSARLSLGGWSKASLNEFQLFRSRLICVPLFVNFGLIYTTKHLLDLLNI